MISTTIARPTSTTWPSHIASAVNMRILALSSLFLAISSLAIASEVVPVIDISTPDDTDGKGSSSIPPEKRWKILNDFYWKKYSPDSFYAHHGGLDQHSRNETIPSSNTGGSPKNLVSPLLLAEPRGDVTPPTAPTVVLDSQPRFDSRPPTEDGGGSGGVLDRLQSWYRDQEAHWQGVLNTARDTQERAAEQALKVREAALRDEAEAEEKKLREEAEAEEDQLREKAEAEEDQLRKQAQAHKAALRKETELQTAKLQKQTSTEVHTLEDDGLQRVHGLAENATAALRGVELSYAHQSALARADLSHVGDDEAALERSQWVGLAQNATARLKNVLARSEKRLAAIKSATSAHLRTAQHTAEVQLNETKDEARLALNRTSTASRASLAEFFSSLKAEYEQGRKNNTQTWNAAEAVVREKLAALRGENAAARKATRKELEEDLDRVLNETEAKLQAEEQAWEARKVLLGKSWDEEFLARNAVFVWL